MPGVTAEYIGQALDVDPDGTLREGPMVVPRPDGVVLPRIADALRLLQPVGPTVASATQKVPDLHQVSAEELLGYFIAKAVEGDAQVCTYGWAYRKLLKASYVKFSMAYAQKVIQLACRTHPRELPGLGPVRLDTFIVLKKDGMPSGGYWLVAHHDREEWERVLGNARVLD